MGEEGARDCTPTPLQSPCFSPRVWVVVKGRRGALSLPSLASHLADPSPRPEVLSSGLGRGSPWTGGVQAGNNGVIFLDNGGLVRKPGGEWRGNSPGPRVTGLTSQPGLGLTSPNSPPKDPPSWRPAPGPQKGEVETMGGKRKRCERPGPLPTPQRPAWEGAGAREPSGTLRGGSLALSLLDGP